MSLLVSLLCYSILIFWLSSPLHLPVDENTEFESLLWNLQFSESWRPTFVEASCEKWDSISSYLSRTVLDGRLLKDFQLGKMFKIIVCNTIYLHNCFSDLCSIEERWELLIRNRCEECDDDLMKHAAYSRSEGVVSFQGKELMKFYIIHKISSTALNMLLATRARCLLCIMLEKRLNEFSVCFIFTTVCEIVWMILKRLMSLVCILGLQKLQLSMPQC